MNVIFFLGAHRKCCAQNNDQFAIERDQDNEIQQIIDELHPIFV